MASRHVVMGRRVLGFVVLPFLSSMAPFILLPLLARRVSSAEWAGLGIGQAVGMMGAVVVTWGWQLLGPVLVAGADRDVARRHYLTSLVVRSLVCLVLTPALMLLSGLIAHDGGRLLAMAMTCAVCLSGLTPTWFFIGLGRPSGIATWDVLPRVVATVVAAALVVAGVGAVCYPVALSVAGLAGTGVFSFLELRGAPLRGQLVRLPSLRSELGRGFSPMGTELTLSLYSSGSVAAVGWRATTETVAVYSSAFRLYRLAVYVVTALANALQGWVAEKQGAERRRRMVRALQAHTAVGLVGLIGMAALLPEVSTLLFGSRLSVDFVSSVYLGIAFMAASIGNCLGRHVLIPAGATQGVFWSTLGAAAVGLPLSVIWAVQWGASGATAALAVSQVVVIVLVAKRCLRVFRELEDDTVVKLDQPIEASSGRE